MSKPNNIYREHEDELSLDDAADDFPSKAARSESASRMTHLYEEVRKENLPGFGSSGDELDLNDESLFQTRRSASELAPGEVAEEELAPEALEDPVHDPNQLETILELEEEATSISVADPSRELEKADIPSEEATSDEPEEDVVELETVLELDEEATAIPEAGGENREERFVEPIEKKVELSEVISAPPEKPAFQPKREPIAESASATEDALSDAESETRPLGTRQFINALKSNRIVQIQAVSLMLLLFIALASGILVTLIFSPNNGSQTQQTTFVKADFKIPDTELQSRIVDNRILGRLFVLTGNVYNQSGETLRSIRIAGRLYSKDGFYKEETVSCGNLLSESELAVSDMKSIQNRLSAPYDQGNSATRISPNDSRPFMIVFDQLPADPNLLDTFSVEVKDAAR